MDRHLYFVHALPSDATSISLIELHGLLEDYINRNEGEMAELERERAARSWRKTEGKGKRETEMDKQREVELAEYKTGFSASFSSSSVTSKRTDISFFVSFQSFPT